MTLPSLPEPIAAVCREYYGTIRRVRGKLQLVDNRCDTCPLRAPCLAWGSAPARTLEELAANRETFVAAATTVLGGRR